MPKVSKPANQKGDFLVDYEEKVFEDVKADPGEKALENFLLVAATETTTQEDIAALADALKKVI